MNVYKPTGEKTESWPQWVGRLSEENLELKKRVEQLERENAELKKRCCDLFSEVIEAKASHAK
jgi:predicted RNase H-like nuclease (RuvC/YqgF family)